MGRVENRLAPAPSSNPNAGRDLQPRTKLLMLLSLCHKKNYAERNKLFGGRIELWF